MIAAKGNNTTDDIDIRSTTQNVTGGTLQMGTGASSGNQISLINSAGGAVSLWNLVLAQSSANNILQRSSINVLNDLTIGSLNTLIPNAGLAINVGGGNGAGGGNWINNGAFTQSTTVVSLLGTASSTVGGTGATTFYQLTVNKTAASLANRKATLGVGTTVTNGLTLTNGFIDAAAFSVVIPAGGSVARGGACSADGSVNGCFVSGNLQKNFAVSGGAQTRVYEVGSATATLVAYAPVSLALATVTTAGNIVVSTTAGDSPNIGSSPLDASKSANRYWTLANSGTVFSALAGNSLTFNFVAADLDAMATPANFNVGRYGGSWTATPPPPPTRTATSTAVAGTTLTTAALPGQYAVAETGVAVGSPGSFNTFETSTAPSAIVGVIKTKIAGAAFGLDVVAINGGAQTNSFGASVKVELLANTGGAYGADNCPLANSVLQTIASAAIAGGRSTVNFAAVADAYRDVRVRVSFPTAAPTVASCSTDSFAIRPSAFVNFSVTDTDAQTAGVVRTLGNVTFAGGAVVHKAGRNFTVHSDAVNAAGAPAITANYTGAPAVVLSACGASAPCTSAFGGLTLDATHTAGRLASSAASYNQVGSFTMQLVDSAFASIDSADGSTLAERTIQSSAISVGRFVPDHFAVALNAPMFQTACAVGGFTYVGQKFGYSTVPVITVTAEDASNNPTTFYSGSWWRLTNASLSGETYAAVTGTLDASGIPGTDPAIAPSAAGIGTLTFDSGTGLFFGRAGVSAPFAANVSLAINVLDADGVAATVNPVTFGAAAGILFSTGTAIRYGRVRLLTAVGSELVDLPVAMVAEYYAGAGSGFVANTDDACTSGVSLALSTYTKNLSPGETCVRDGGSPGASGSGCAPAAPLAQRYHEPPVLGDFDLQLAAPGAGNNGSVKITAAVPAWLQYDWDAGTPGDENPTGEATFGIFGGESKQIYSREIY
jgi:MSHA biogenesis protein MshQ